jgi:hypothetical protein
MKKKRQVRSGSRYYLQDPNETVEELVPIGLFLPTVSLTENLGFYAF